MAVALVVAIVTLSGGSGATDAYHAMYRNVTGVKFGTQVLYEGYPIGQVEAVTPVPEGGRHALPRRFRDHRGLAHSVRQRRRHRGPEPAFGGGAGHIGRGVGDVVEAGRPPAEPRVREHVLGGRRGRPAGQGHRGQRPAAAAGHRQRHRDDLRRHPGRPGTGPGRGIERPGDRPVAARAADRRRRRGPGDPAQETGRRTGQAVQPAEPQGPGTGHRQCRQRGRQVHGFRHRTRQDA